MGSIPRPRVVGQVYPWDLADDPARSTEVVAAGFDEVAIAVSYHAVRAVRWTQGGAPTIVHEPSSAAYVRFDSTGWGRLRPSAPQTVEEGAFERSFTSAVTAGLDVRAWLSLVHDDEQLALRHPDLAVVDVWGNRSRVGLCPAQPDVAEYCRNLVLGTVRETGLTSLFIESLTAPGLKHSVAHDKLGYSGFSPLATLILSICTCEACVGAAIADDWDVEELIALGRRATAQDEAPAGLKSLVNHALSTRARLAYELASSISEPVDGRRLDVAVAASSRMDSFGAYAPLDRLPPGATVLCAELSAAANAGWRDLRAWHTTGLELKVGRIDLTQEANRSTRESPSERGEAARLDQLYVYHVGMRRPGTLRDINTDPGPFGS